MTTPATGSFCVGIKPFLQAHLVLEKSRRWQKMLDTVDKAASSSVGQVLANPTYQNDAACTFPLATLAKCRFEQE
jgi:hypothetical protein